MTTKEEKIASLKQKIADIEAKKKEIVRLFTAYREIEKVKDAMFWCP